MVLPLDISDGAKATLMIGDGQTAVLSGPNQSYFAHGQSEQSYQTFMSL